MNNFFDFGFSSKTFLGGILFLLPTIATLLGYDMTSEVAEASATVPAQVGDVVQSLGVLLASLGIRTAIHRSGVGQLP